MSASFVSILSFLVTAYLLFVLFPPPNLQVSASSLPIFTLINAEADIVLLTKEFFVDKLNTALRMFGCVDNLKC